VGRNQQRLAPPGNLNITVTAHYKIGSDTVQLRTLHGSTRGTSVASPPGGPETLGSGGVLTVTVVAHGPAGTKGPCTKEFS
jgi:hypothetical protein